MAYEPNKPWDSTLSYSYGQTCTYNGYPYIWFVALSNSTAGVKPNVETASFTAIGDGSTDSRMDRAWVLADSGGFGAPPSYGSAATTFPLVRGLPKGASLSGIKLGYPQGLKVAPYQGILPDQTGKASWRYYDWPLGMSRDYEGSFQYVGVYWPTKDNPADYPVQRPNQDNAFLPTVEEVYPEDADPDVAYFQSFWSMGENEALAEGGADTVAQMIWLERDYEYTITVNFYKTVDDAEVLISTESKSNSITTPSLEEGWTLGANVTEGPVDTFDKPTDTEYYTFGYAITSIAPALDA